MDAACTIQDSIHVFSLVRKYVSRILGTYQYLRRGFYSLKNGFTKVIPPQHCGGTKGSYENL